MPTDQKCGMLSARKWERPIRQQEAKVTGYNRNSPVVAFDEVAVDRWANQRAKEYIAEQPAMFAYASVVRVGRFWQLMPHRVARSESTLRFFSRFAVAMWYVLVFAAAVMGVIAQRKQLLRGPWLYGLLLVFSLTCVHAIYWSNMRMRAPLMPVVAVCAAAGLAAMQKHFIRHSTSVA